MWLFNISDWFVHRTDLSTCGESREGHNISVYFLLDVPGSILAFTLWKFNYINKFWLESSASTSCGFSVNAHSSLLDLLISVDNSVHFSVLLFAAAPEELCSALYLFRARRAQGQNKKFTDNCCLALLVYACKAWSANPCSLRNTALHLQNRHSSATPERRGSGLCRIQLKILDKQTNNQTNKQPNKQASKQINK